MAGESQQIPASGTPDPTVFTTEALERQRTAERDYTDAQLEVLRERLDGIDRATVVFNDTLTAVPTETQKEIAHVRELVFERIEAQRREGSLREAHRQELKLDAEKALLTAREADQKAVQAALAAAEKARDQQVIASQLATSKSEETAKDQQGQQGATFTLAIAGLTTGLNDLKQLMAEMRAEQRGATQHTLENRAQQTDNRAGIGTVVLIAGFCVSVIALIAMILVNVLVT